MYIISNSFNSVDVLKFVRNGLKEKQETLLQGKTNMQQYGFRLFPGYFEGKGSGSFNVGFFFVCVCIMSSKYQFTSFDIAKKSLSHFHKACWYFSISSEVHWSVSDKEITGNSKIKLKLTFYIYCACTISLY